MALIKCKECKKEISDSAKACPNCGYNKKNYSKLKVFDWFLAFLFIVTLIFQWYIIYNCMVSNSCRLRVFLSWSSSDPVLFFQYFSLLSLLWGGLLSINILIEHELWLWDRKIAVLVIGIPHLMLIVWGAYCIWQSWVEDWKKKRPTLLIAYK